MFFLPLVFFSIVFMTGARMGWSSQKDNGIPPVVTAGAAVLVDARTGQVLYGKNEGQKRPPASTTKIMTALLALEGGDLKQTVTVSPRAASVGEASLDLKAGEKLTLEELIYGALLHSGNDACVAIAEHIAGTEKNFVLLMNQKAKMIGAKDTTFKNTNGLPAPGHLTTAKDLAVLTRYALSNSTFQKIVRTREKTIGEQEKRYLHNTNRLLWSYDWINGVKTGTTNEAGCCLVASAAREGRQLISVVLHS
ncbi:MAG: D-alanyl-D-alanine carboxypeptidase, partial [Firmicutes bacterium]|nr:D-alanyl-D-alanine carboxypeptidase [Bacillota bacterium]